MIYGDPLTAPFWAAATRGELLIQHCDVCGRFQFYPRPFCLNCQADTVSWVAAAGTGTIYSLTMVQVPVVPDLAPPYLVALVELDEGPRLLTQILDDEAAIGDRVRVGWRARSEAPPLPIFVLVR